MMIKSLNDQEFTYDQESRITSVTRNGQTVNYAYNGLDTRTSVTMGSTVNTFLRDGAYVTDPVLVDSGATYTPGISERRGMTTTYMHSGLKNAFAQSDTSQVVAATREYDAFGNVTSGTGLWAGPFGYAGKFGYQSPSIPGTSTPDEGLTLIGHRYYDPSTGRFLTRDPIFDGRNWYSYGGGEANPLTGADPTGLVRISAFFYEVVAGAVHWYLVIEDNVKGSLTYGQKWIISAGPEFYGNGPNWGQLESKSGKWRDRATQDRRRTDGGIVLVDNQDPIGPYLDKAFALDERLNKMDITYHPIFTSDDGKTMGNSNSWIYTVVKEMGLLPQFDKAIRKRGAMPWTPGWKDFLLPR